MKIQVSIGELVDKVAILSIKVKKITTSQKLIHVQKELDFLQKAMESIEINPDSTEVNALMRVNLKLWDLENAIRLKEKKVQFDDEFIRLARAIYRFNDERTMLKRKISLKYHSELIEEKEYEPS